MFFLTFFSVFAYAQSCQISLLSHNNLCVLFTKQKSRKIELFEELAWWDPKANPAPWGDPRKAFFLARLG